VNRDPKVIRVKPVPEANKVQQDHREIRENKVSKVQKVLSVQQVMIIFLPRLINRKSLI
jgi:hypothetical protein